jgi:hypothetical protein
MKNPKPRFEEGQLVRSTFRARWVGVVLGVKQWATYKDRRYPIYLVQPTLDSKGNPQPKCVKARTLAEDWLEPVH